MPFWVLRGFQGNPNPKKENKGLLRVLNVNAVKPFNQTAEESAKREEAYPEHPATLTHPSPFPAVPMRDGPDSKAQPKPKKKTRNPKPETRNPKP